MPLTTDELQTLSEIAYLCDGESYEYFADRVVPVLTNMSEGELWALAGMFISRTTPEPAAHDIANYASHVQHLCLTPGKQRMDAVAFIRRLRSNTRWEREEPMHAPDVPEVPF